MLIVNLDGTITADIEENILFEEYESDNDAKPMGKADFFASMTQAQIIEAWERGKILRDLTADIAAF